MGKKKKTSRDKMLKKVDRIDLIMNVNELANYDNDLVCQIKNIAWVIAENEGDPDLFDRVFRDISYSVMFKIRDIKERNILTGKELR